MRVLVTGHRGYLGTILVPLLRQHGHEVCGLDSDLFARCTFGPGLGEADLVPELRKDVRDVSPSDLRGIEAIIHLAGLSNDPLGALNPALTHEINCRATLRLAAIARSLGVRRFIFSSSCSVYGAAGGTLIDERAPAIPVTPYGRSKVAAEAGLARLVAPDFCVTSLRNATVYGASPRLRFDLVLNNLVAWAFATGRVLLKSDGTPWRPLVHVEDVARAFVAVLEAPPEQVQGRVFNVGSEDENYQVRELAEIVAETVPNVRIEYAAGAGPDLRCYRVDCAAFRRAVPSFACKWTARRGAEQLYEVYRAIGLTVADFEGPRYQRIGHLQQLLEEGEVDRSLRWSTAASPSPSGRVTVVPAGAGLS